MFKSLITGAATASLLFLLSAPALAQDLTGTWFKANVAARLLTAETSIIELGKSSGSFEGKPKTVGVKQTVYLRLTKYDGDEYEVVVYVQGADGLIQTGNGDMELSSQGIIENLDIEVPVVQKTPEGVEIIGEFDVTCTGQLTVKLDAKEDIKSAKITTLGGIANGEALLKKELVFGVGTAKVKAKSVPEDKVPPIIDT